MDTRLLRVWSNRWKVKPLILRFFFVIAAYFLFLAEFAKASDSPAALANTTLPIMDIRLLWEKNANHFRGVQYLAIPASELSSARVPAAVRGDSLVSLDFWLLPNRDLRDSTQMALTREEQELRSGAQSIEWPFSDVGLGTLRIQSVATAESVGVCPAHQDLLLQQIKTFSWKPRSFERHDFERHLKVEFQKENKSACYFVMLDFIFEPRTGDGNFAIGREGHGHISGPLFPIWKSRPISTRMRFKSSSSKVNLQCTGCQTSPEGEVFLHFKGLPPSMQFGQSARDPGRVVALRDTEIQKIFSSESVDDEVLRTVNLFIEFARPAIERARNNSGQSWNTSIRTQILLEKLVSEQNREIQLHSSFGKVSPLLAGYHRAALFRALARDFIRHALSPSEENRSWDELRDNEMIARYVAEKWLVSAFPKLNKLKELSDDLSFLPFFRAVQQGNAFLNNAVFVGSEEAPGRLDFSVFDEFFSPLAGIKIVQRINRCAPLDALAELEKMLIEIVEGKKSFSEFRDFIVATKPRQECTTPMRSGLIPESLPEEVIEISPKKSNLQLKRTMIDQPASFRFFFSTSPLRREPIELVTRDVNGVRSEIRIVADEMEEKTLQLPSNVLEAEVLEPNRARTSDRLVWPRPLRTVLQALSLNYDSRRSDVALRSQLQTTQVGDEWGRAVLLGYRREFSRNNLDLQFSTQTPSFVPSTSASLMLASSVRLEKSPPAFLAVSYGVERGVNSVLYPEGVGLKLWLRRPLSLSAFREKMPDPQQEWVFTYASGLAPRLTWSETISYGVSESGVDVGLRSVPAWPSEQFVSRDYGLVRSELRQTLTQNLNASLAKSVLFQHALIYMAHVFAFDQLQTEKRVTVDARVAQSLVFGVRLFGALFGAKDQAISFEVSRAMTSPARTSFGFSLGKAMN